jgi:hypothetical protein
MECGSSSCLGTDRSRQEKGTVSNSLASINLNSSELSIDGVQYDYVWPIQFDTPGMAEAKLGYNVGRKR